MTLTQRLIAGTLVVIAAFVALTVPALDRRLRGRLRADITAELLHEAQLVAVQWKPGLSADSLADTLGHTIRHRVTLIGPDGVVIGDSEFDPPALGELENHARRPEVMAAVARGEGSSMRRSPSQGDEELYVAVKAPLGVARVSVSTKSQAVLASEMRADVLLVSLVGSVIALALTVVLARSTSRPILELRDDARAMAAGDLTRRPSLAASGEVGELATALHRFAEQLAARMEAIETDEALLRTLTESLNEGALAIDDQRQVIHINERARHLLGARDAVPFSADRLPRERMLRQAIDDALRGEATDSADLTIGSLEMAIAAKPLAAGGAVLALLDLTRLRRLEKVRRDFVANVSHELKTPLTVVSGFAETLGDETLPAEQRRQFASAILSNTRRMQRIVDDLLDLSRIESGGWTPNPEDVDVADIAGESVAAGRGRAREKGIDLRADVAPDARTVHADRTALRQILANLVDNAIRHTTQGEVVIFSRRDNGGVVIGVRDTGSGIPREALPRIFERFYRVDAARSRADGGTGLGLSIVRHLVEAHAGRVSADSMLGHGTSIAAFFPSPRAHA